MVDTLITLIIVIAIIAIVWWCISAIALPQPVKIAAIAIVAIISILSPSETDTRWCLTLMRSITLQSCQSRTGYQYALLESGYPLWYS